MRGQSHRVHGTENFTALAFTRVSSPAGCAVTGTVVVDHRGAVKAQSLTCWKIKTLLFYTTNEYSRFIFDKIKQVL